MARRRRSAVRASDGRELGRQLSPAVLSAPAPRPAATTLLIAPLAMRISHVLGDLEPDDVVVHRDDEAVDTGRGEHLVAVADRALHAPGVSTQPAPLRPDHQEVHGHEDEADEHERQDDDAAASTVVGRLRSAARKLSIFKDQSCRGSPPGRRRASHSGHDARATALSPDGEYLGSARCRRCPTAIAARHRRHQVERPREVVDADEPRCRRARRPDRRRRGSRGCDERTRRSGHVRVERLVAAGVDERPSPAACRRSSAPVP